MLLPLKRVAVDNQRSIGNVRRRVSVLVDGSVDRTALAKSVVGSRSLLERNSDIGRILDGLSVPFTTALDDQFRTTDHLDGQRTDTAWTSGWKEQRSNIGVPKDRFYSYAGTPPRQTSSISGVVRSASINGHTTGTGQQDYEAQRSSQQSAERSRPVSAFRGNERRQENTNTSAYPTDIHAENSHTFQGTGNPQDTAAAKQEEQVPLVLTDCHNGSSVQLHYVPLGLLNSEDKESSQFGSIPEGASNTENRGSANLSSIPADQPNSKDRRSSQTGSIPQTLPDPHDSRSQQVDTIPEGALDSRQRRSMYSTEGNRRSAETTEIVATTEKEEATSQHAETSGVSQRSVSAHSVRETRTPAARVTLHVDNASNARAQVTQHVNTATSTLPDLHRQGRNMSSVYHL